MMFVDVFEAAFAAKITPRFVGGRDSEFAGTSMEWMHGADAGVVVDGGVFAFLEGDSVTPFAGFVG